MDATGNPKKAVPAPAETAGKGYVEDFRGAGHETVEWIASYFNAVAELPAQAQVKPGERLDALPAAAPEQGESYAAILNDFDRIIMPAVTQWNHPRFFAYFA